MKKAKWIFDDDYMGNTGCVLKDAHCSRCGFKHETLCQVEHAYHSNLRIKKIWDPAKLLLPYCPMCGKRMENAHPESEEFQNYYGPGKGKGGKK